MGLELVKQNAKSLMESIYEYERLVNEKAPEKKLQRVREYAIQMIKSIRKITEKEKGELNE